MLSLEKNQQKREIDLLLSSSGVRAPCFVGALKGIKEKGYHIQRIAGTSGGAIIAAAYALDLDTEKLLRGSTEIPYETFRDFKLRNLLSLKNPSIYTGKHLDKYYQSIYGEATLKDFKIDCRIAVVTIAGRQRKILTAETHPDLPVWKAVRMSSTIPFIFPWCDLDGEPVTDGGLVTGLADMFPDKERPIVALRPRADHRLRKAIHNFQGRSVLLWNYIKIVAEYLADAVDEQHIPDKEWGRTIVIPTLEIGGFNFNLTAEDVEKLVQSGYDAVIASELLPVLSE